jgi:TRAP-type C4-dicarboxylate transport system permease small subunit
MRRLLNFLYDAAGTLAAFFVFAIFAVMIVGTVMRELGLRTGGSDDLVAWFCAASSFLAMAFEIASLAVAACAVGYLAFWAFRFAYESWQFHDMANGLIAVPLWIPQTSFVVGALLFFIAVVDELVLVLRGERPTYVTAAEERHARGDFSEDL